MSAIVVLHHNSASLADWFWWWEEENPPKNSKLFFGGRKEKTHPELFLNLYKCAQLKERQDNGDSIQDKTDILAYTGGAPDREPGELASM